MTYSLAMLSPAVRDLDRLPPRTALAVVEFLHGDLMRSPRRVGRPLRFALAGLSSARRGPYRVIYSVDDDTHAVTVHRIGHRRDVYRRA